MVAPRNRAAFSSSVIRPSHSTLRPSPLAQRVTSAGRRSRPTARRRGRGERTRRAAPRHPCAARAARGRRSPVACRRVASPSAYRSTSTPFGTISQSVPNVSATWRAACSDTAVAMARRRSADARASGTSGTRVAARPRGMEGADRGDRGTEERGVVGPRRKGSCRCTTSGSNVRSASIVRRATARPVAIGEIEPLLTHAHARPDRRDPRLRRRAVARRR